MKTRAFSNNHGVALTCGTIAVIILVVLCAFGALECVTEARSERAQLQHKAQLVIQRISNSAEHALWGMDMRGLQSLLAAEMGDPDIVGLVIKEGQSAKVTMSVTRNSNGQVVVGTGECPPAAVRQTRDIIHDRKTIGVASIHVSDAPLRRQLHAILLKNLCRILVLLAFILPALFWVIRRNVVRPISRVIERLDEVIASSGLSVASLGENSATLAEGAGEQAAALEETSASLEEMSSMTQSNAENAQRSNDLAKQARAAAEKGVADMQTMSAAMQAIKASSDDIAKILKTIDEIAFQTNLLALNAAVEAARAGEAGMGFAVVADEVRSLAQRAAAAARETAAKIDGAINRSTQGVETSNKVASALNDIVAKARQVDELVTEVAVASQEQSQGITQINTAVSQMDKVTQRNAANAEESAAAAEELNAQAEAMKDAVRDLLCLVNGRAAGVVAEAGALTAASPQRAKPAPTKAHAPGRNGRSAPAISTAPSLVSPPRQTTPSAIPMEGEFKEFLNAI